MSKTQLDATEAKTVAAFDLEAELQLQLEPPGRAGEDIRFAYSLAGNNPLTVDVGCGYGRTIPHLQEIGPFQYTGIDPSFAMLEIGRRKHPGMDFRRMNLYEMPQQFPEDHFSLAIAITTLSYVTTVRMRQALTCIRKVVAHGGVGYFTFMDVTETISFALNESRGPDYKGPVATLTGWSPERIVPILKRSGFKPERIYNYANSPLYSMIVRAV